MKPDRNTLEELYLVDKLSTRAIGEMYGVRHISIMRWLASYRIPTRPIGRGLAFRGLPEPTPDDLQRLVHQEFRSYYEIADIYHVDYTAVEKWLKKYSIPKPDSWQSRRGKPMPQPPISEVTERYSDGQSLTSMAQTYGVGHSTISQWLKHAGVEIRPDGWDGGKRLTCNDGHLVRSTYELRVDNWLSEKGIEHTYEPSLPFDRRYHADFMANGWFIEIWGVVNSPKYKARTAKKIALYKAHAAPLIEVPVHAFDSQRRGLWKRILPRCLTPASFMQVPRIDE